MLGSYGFREEGPPDRRLIVFTGGASSDVTQFEIAQEIMQTDFSIERTLREKLHKQRFQPWPSTLNECLPLEVYFKMNLQVI